MGHIIYYQEGGIDSQKLIFCLGFLLIVGSILIFTSHPYANDNNSPSEEEQVKILEELKDKTQNKYTIGTFKIISNEINIEIFGTQEYYNSIKNEVEQLVKNTIKPTAFKNYSVNIIQSNINQIIPEEHRGELFLLKEIYTSINDDLVEFYPKHIERININNTSPELSVKIRTSLDEKQDSIGKEMADRVYKNIEKELSSNKLIKEKPIKIYIYNKVGEKIN